MYPGHLKMFIALLIFTNSVFASVQACQYPKGV